MIRKNSKLFSSKDIRTSLLKKMQDNNHVHYDICDAMLTMNFELFCMYYEKAPIHNPEWCITELHETAKEEMDRLYFWWTEIRVWQQNRYERVEKELNKKYPASIHFLDGGRTIMKAGVPLEKSDKLFEIERWLIETDQRNLASLISIREWFYI